MPFYIITHPLSRGYTTGRRPSGRTRPGVHRHPSRRGGSLRLSEARRRRPWRRENRRGASNDDAMRCERGRAARVHAVVEPATTATPNDDAMRDPAPFGVWSPRATVAMMRVVDADARSFGRPRRARSTVEYSSRESCARAVDHGRRRGRRARVGRRGWRRQTLNREGAFPRGCGVNARAPRRWTRDRVGWDVRMVFYTTRAGVGARNAFERETRHDD
jgi:hypothetical protein